MRTIPSHNEGVLVIQEVDLSLKLLPGVSQKTIFCHFSMADVHDNTNFQQFIITKKSSEKSSKNIFSATKVLTDKMCHLDTC